MWLFATARRGQTAGAAREEWAAKGHDVKYVQDKRTLDRLGHHMVYEYQDIFGFTEEQMADLLVYMRYFTVLRQCCGDQMSDDWRQALLPEDKKRKGYRPHHGAASPSFPACEMYDIDTVERLFMGTKIFQLSEQHGVYTNPATVFNGSACSTYNHKVRTEGLGHDQRWTLMFF